VKNAVAIQQNRNPLRDGAVASFLVARRIEIVLCHMPSPFEAFERSSSFELFLFCAAQDGRIPPRPVLAIESSGSTERTRSHDIFLLRAEASNW
jgi:hypothetical protein